MPEKQRSPKAFRKIVWSIDALPDDPRLQGKVADVLQALQKSGDAEITPVYVFSDQLLGLDEALTEKQFVSYGFSIEKALITLLSTFKIPGVQEPVVIPLRKGSTKVAIKKLVGYSKRVGANLIVIGSHARQGVSRFVMGSFAETLAHNSKIPVLIVNPKTKIPAAIKKILFPTDFSATSKKAFKSALRLASACGAEITLFHQLSSPSRIMIEMGSFSTFGLGYSLTEYSEQERLKRDKQAAEWLKFAKEFDVKVKVLIKSEPNKASDSAVQAAQDLDVDLIAMASQSTPVSAVLLGSVSRNVIRHAGCPVWVLHF